MPGLVRGPVATPVSFLTVLGAAWLVWTGGGGSTTAADLVLLLREMSAAAATAASHRRGNGDAASFSLSLHVRLNVSSSEADAARRALGPALGMNSRGHGRPRGYTCPAWASWATGSSLPEAMNETVNRVVKKVRLQLR